MALLRETATNRTQTLEPEHLIGRASTCSLRIEQRYVSARHAIVRWSGDRWELKDFGSKNGTFLDGVRLRPGDDYKLTAGSTIQFGKAEQEWVLADAAAPTVMAVALDGAEPVLMEGELLPLPSADDPQATIYRNAEGNWVIEQPDESIVAITNLQLMEVDGRTFRFCCPESLCKTSLAESGPDLEVRHLRLMFSVSRDEEHVEIRATCGARSFDLGARAHNYLLLTLARRRLDDAAEGLPETTCGWVYLDDLAHDPSMAPPQLNIDVFRIRKQFASLGVLDAAAIIERRPRTQQLRIGVTQLSVVSL